MRLTASVDMQLNEMNVPEARVLEKLNAVSTAKRLANMVSTSYMCESLKV